MLRTSISRLLTAFLGVLVAALIGSTLHIAWQARNQADHASLVQKLAEADRSIFTSIVSIRSQVPRIQTALVGVDAPGPVMAQARGEAAAELNAALDVLETLAVAGKNELVKSINAGRSAVTAAATTLDEQARRSRPDRDLRATDPWRLAVFSLADALSAASIAVGNTVRQEDPLVGEMVEVRWNAWRIRDSYGFQCSALRPFINRGQAPDEQLAGSLRQKRGATDAYWQMLRDLLAHPDTPAPLATAVRTAQDAAAAAQGRIDKTVAGLGPDATNKPAMPGAEWTALCNGPFDAILAIGYKALDITAEHAATVQANARTRMITAAAMLGLALVLGVVILVFVHRRLSRPVAVLASAMHSLSHGRLDVEIPGADRHDELGAIARAVGDIVLVLRGLNEEMQRLNGRLPPVDGDGDSLPPVAFEGDFAEMASLMRETRAAFSEIGAQAIRVADAAATATHAVARVSLGAETQTMDLEAVALSMSETVQAIAHVSDSARDASEMVRTTAEFADRGKDDMSRLLNLSQTIGDNTRRVRNITDAIGDIAETTNILSLNAAIEAARAGAQGRGFAVVAEEVGRLAESASESANRVRDIVGEASKLAEEGMEVTDTTWRMMDDLAQRVMQLDDMIQSIAAAMEQQRVTIAAIEGNFGNVRAVAQTNAAASQEISVTMGQLASIAEATRALAARFHAG